MKDGKDMHLLRHQALHRAFLELIDDYEAHKCQHSGDPMSLRDWAKAQAKGVDHGSIHPGIP
jgi:hypothetical protein